MSGWVRPDDTVFALSSGPGVAGIAVVRLSGQRVGDVLQALGGALPAPRRASLRTLRAEDGTVLDRAIVLFFPGPNSATGEDVGELHVHGGRAVVRTVLERLSRFPGCRPAFAGAFTRRAFLNGRMDLTEVEGLADLLGAETEGQRRAALRAALGEHRLLYMRWRDRLLTAMAQAEASVDFVDEDDVGTEAGQRARELLRALAADVAAHLAVSRDGERMRDGMLVVLAGPPNAGKSTLLNRLARREVAIVDRQPGTTRDTLEVHLDLAGLPVTLVDTAGLRHSLDPVEAEGVRRTRERSGEADLVVWLSPADAPASPPDGLGRQIWIVRSKIDLVAGSAQGDDLGICALSGAGVPALLDRLRDQAAEALGSGEQPVIARRRHRAALETCLDSLEHALELADSTELALEHMREAAAALGIITGHVGVEDVLDVIFRDFCIGK